MPELTTDIVDAHVRVAFATHGANPAPPGSTEIQEIYQRAQAAPASRSFATAERFRTPRRLRADPGFRR